MERQLRVGRGVHIGSDSDRSTNKGPSVEGVEVCEE